MIHVWTCADWRKILIAPSQLRSDKMTCLVSALIPLSKHSFPIFLVPHFLHFYAKVHFFFIFVGDLLFKVALKHSAKMLSSVPQGKEGCDVPHREKMCVR